jgi:cytochrome c peroxidase
LVNFIFIVLSNIFNIFDENQREVKLMEMNCCKEGKNSISAFLAIILPLILFSCKKDHPAQIEIYQPTLPDTPYNYSNVTLPSSFTSSPMNFFNSISNSNPITDAGATLGRVLFYDRQLSRNNKVSCSTCHQQEFAFANNTQFSKGLYNEMTSRNSMAIINTRFSFRFFWDMRSVTLENQVLEPIKNHVEMDMTLDEVVDKVKLISYYPELFQDAFGTTEVTSQRISYALSQFLHSMVSYQSKYDQGVDNNFADYTQLELDGKDLFFSGTVNCNHCHFTVNFFGNQPAVNGLDATYTDNGLGTLTGDPADEGKFKIPTLRNIEMTAPYMHDGRFATLEEVIEHYNSGIQAHPNLDDRLTVEGQIGGTPKQYNMTSYQKQSLVAFLKTLTDHSFLTDVRFSDPFK